MERTSSCPVRDNLGDGVPPLEEGKLSKATNVKDTVGSSHNQVPQSLSCGAYLCYS